MTVTTIASSAIAVSTPDLTIVEGKVTTTSLQVAEHFGKAHKSVLRAIRNLECSPDFHQHNFAPLITEYKNGKGGTQQAEAFTMTRDGFVFLAMGFTGKEAAQWKEAYITAFNKMEHELLARTARPFNPALDYDRISPAQAQDLKEIVDAIVRAGVQGHRETWSRLHKKFRVNSYLQLAATRHTEARQYLIGKLPYGYATGDVQHEPTAQALSDQVARWVRQLETDNGAMVEVFMPIYRAVRKQVERPGTLNVDRRKLAAIWVDLGKLKSRVDGLGVLESDLPPSWWQSNAISLD